MKISLQIMQRIDIDNLADDITAWRQIRPSIFMFKWNRHIFRDTGHSFFINHHHS